MTEEKGEKPPVIDLISQILAVDLTTPREFGFQPIPEGHTVLGVMSENAQKAMCLCTDLNQQVVQIGEELKAFDEVHNQLHESGEPTLEDCKHNALGRNAIQIRQRMVAETSDKLCTFFWAMVKAEFPMESSNNGRRLHINEGFVVSMLPLAAEYGGLDIDPFVAMMMTQGLGDPIFVGIRSIKTDGASAPEPEDVPAAQASE